VPGGKIRAVAAVHTSESLQATAAAHVAKSVVLHANRRQFAKGGKVRQAGERLIVDLLQSDAEAA